MAFMNWDEEVTFDVSWLDEEHRALVDLLNEIHANVQAGEKNFRLHYLLDRLISCTESHFAEEERQMLRIGYPNHENHRLQHKVLLNEIRSLQTAYREDYISLSLDALTQIKSWLTNHVANMDSDLARFAKRFSELNPATDGPADL